MNKNIYKISFILSTILLIIFFILENHRKTLSGTYIGYKCTPPFTYILTLNDDKTFQFKHENYILIGKWSKSKKGKIIFISHENNIKDIATFNRHNIQFNTNNHDNKNFIIPYAHQCSTYSGSEKKWWENIWGFFSLIIFIINLPLSILGILKLNKQNSTIN